MHKEILKIAITGHVDHGKSTLIGRLLIETRSLSKDKQKEIKKIAKEFGRDTELAYLSDQLKEERQGNLTIDTTEIFLKTSKRDYCLVDTPGHLEFIKNTLTGASRADAALLIIDADEGVQEQTRRHAYLIKLLMLNNVIVVVNKMDLIGYDQVRFQEIKDDVSSLLTNLHIDMVDLIPVSAQKGVNISCLWGPGPAGKMSWYKGKALLPAMDALRITKSEAGHHPLRFPVQDIYKMNDEHILVGRIASGSLQRGEEVTLIPSRKEAIINEIKTYRHKKSKAQAGESIGITLSPYPETKRGDIVCARDSCAVVANGFLGNTFWTADTPLKKTDTVTVRCATQECDAIVTRIEKRMDPASLKILEEDAQELKINEAGSVTFKLNAPAVIEPFRGHNELGRYVIERDNCFQGAGTVVEKH